MFQQGYNHKGLIAADKSTRKEAFDILAGFYREIADQEQP